MQEIRVLMYNFTMENQYYYLLPSGIQRVGFAKSICHSGNFSLVDGQFADLHLILFSKKMLFSEKLKQIIDVFTKDEVFWETVELVDKYRKGKNYFFGHFPADDDAIDAGLSQLPFEGCYYKPRFIYCKIKKHNIFTYNDNLFVSEALKSVINKDNCSNVCFQKVQ